MQYIHFLNIFLLFNLTINTESLQSKSRQKRYIIFPEGSSFIQMVLGLGLPMQSYKQSITVGPFLKSFYYLPMNSSYFTNPSININQERRKRAASTRWNFYNTLSNAAKFLGYGGKSCVLRTICEIAEIPFSEDTDIFTEILHVIFTPSTTLEEVDHNYDYEYIAAEKLGKTSKNCARIFSECKVNLIDSFTEIFSHIH